MSPEFIYGRGTVFLELLRSHVLRQEVQRMLVDRDHEWPEPPQSRGALHIRLPWPPSTNTYYRRVLLSGGPMICTG